MCLVVFLFFKKVVNDHTAAHYIYAMEDFLFFKT